MSNKMPNITIVSSTNITELTRLKISGTMALALWFGTAIVIGCHMFTIVALSYQLSGVETEKANSKEKVENIQKSIASVDGTAKTLYSFLTPFAAAVTGFFFSEVTSGRNQKEKEETAELTETK